MNTFIPYADFQQSARCLDRARLGKQRLEAMTLWRAITSGNGWSRHPAARMWQGFPDALLSYYNTMLEEWARRGYRNDKLTFVSLPEKIIMPPWWGEEKVHSSHRANLLRKDFAWYSQFGWNEKPTEGYVWPVA